MERNREKININVVKEFDKINIIDILDYEVRAHWLAKFIFFEWGQNLIAKHIARKTRKKYNRYLKSIEITKKLKRKGKS